MVSTGISCTTCSSDQKTSRDQRPAQCHHSFRQATNAEKHFHSKYFSTPTSTNEGNPSQVMLNFIIKLNYDVVSEKFNEWKSWNRKKITNRMLLT